MRNGDKNTSHKLVYAGAHLGGQYTTKCLYGDTEQLTGSGRVVQFSFIPGKPAIIHRSYTRTRSREEDDIGILV